MKIIFRNLSRETSEEQMLELFSTYGRVQSCDLVLDQVSGQSKGFGFVNMPVAAEAKTAIRKTNGQIIDGASIRVKKAQEGTEAAKKTDKKLDAASAESTSTPHQEAKPTRPVKKDGRPLGAKKPRTFKKGK
ncbi:MAG: RNA-binding protein [Pseudohongiellaceae bacterium]|nr:RNA-binding protein [Pseudohongiellaceae bacterium]